MNIGIAVVSNRDWKPQFGRSMCGLIEHLLQYGPSYGVRGYRRYDGTNWSGLSEGRQRVLDTVIKDGMTHLWCADDDMEFRPDIIKIMASRNVPVIGVNAVTRGGNDVDHGTALALDGSYIDSSRKDGIEEVKFIGGGIFMVDLRAIKHIPAPHFEKIWLPETKSYIPEDYYFFQKLRQAGLKIFVDHDASKGVKHWGNFGYDFEAIAKIQKQ